MGIRVCLYYRDVRNGMRWDGDSVDKLIGRVVKVVYSEPDGNRIKVIRGVLENSDMHTLTIRTLHDKDVVVIGKAFVVSVRVNER